MNHSDIAALMKGAAPAIRDYVAAAMQPLVERISDLERELAAARSVDHSAPIKAAVEAAVAALPKPDDGKNADPAEVARLVDDAVSRLPPAEPGKDADPEVIRSMVVEAVAALPPALPGNDADMDAVERMVSEQVGRAVSVIEPRGADLELLRSMVAEEIAKVPPAQPGKDADMVEVVRIVAEAVQAGLTDMADMVVPQPDAALLRSVVAEEVAKLPPASPGKDAEPPTEVALRALIAPLVESAVAAIEKPKDGSSVTIEDLRPMVEEVAAELMKAIPAPKDGEPGADGRMPIVKAYAEGVHYTGDVVTHGGATYQASKDTGREPPHEDWVCLARAGRDGQDGADGRSFRIRGTYAEGLGDYAALDVVSLNGGAFIAKKDAPGVCPGPDWQLVASQGKRGASGEPGKPGQRGAAAPVVVSMNADESGMLTLVNADGSAVECDLYPLLAKVG